jgi:DNA polymerase-4
MDAYFASIELLGREELLGKPVIVGGDPGFRSVVTSCTYEARALGVHAGMSMAMALRLAPNAVLLQGSFGRYQTYTERILRVLLQFTHLVHAASIDEAFMDVTALPGGIESKAGEVQDAIYGRVALWASVGCGPNRLLAKMASKRAKPRGVALLTPDDMPPLPVSAIWGVGPETATKLRALGVDTIGKLRLLSRGQLRAVLGIHGEELYLQARGFDDRPVTPFGHIDPPKSMGHEHTFPRDVLSPGEYLPALARVCQKTARRARDAGFRGRTLILKYRLRNLKRLTLRRSLPLPSNQDQTLFRIAREMALSAIRSPIRLIGVSISDLEPCSEAQLTFFPERTEALNRAADQVRTRYGERAISSARALYSPGQGGGPDAKSVTPG